MPEQSDGENSAVIRNPARVVIRFVAGIRLSDGPNASEEVEERGLGPWRQLTQEFPGLQLSPVFTEPQNEGLQALIRSGTEIDPSYQPADFGTFYYVDAPPETDLVALVKALLTWSSVAEAYIDQAGPDPHRLGGRIV
jgi:hypothetical protein